MNVIVRKRAEKSLEKIADYIANKGFPNTAIEFLERMRDFTYSLGDFPEKYPVCRNSSFRKRKFRCAVFEENFIFVHKVIDGNMILLNIVHASRLR